MGDAREAELQRASLAREMATVVQGFDQVRYPDWDALFSRWWREASPGSALVLDEFPALVAQDPSVPSVLQRHLDQPGGRGRHLVLCGSSQRMMQGLVLDRTAPLFGRAREILRIQPLGAGWIGEALRLKSPSEAVAAYAVWGGVPRYWELAREFRETFRAVRELVLDPLGVLHQEPLTLLAEDLRDTAQSASLLQLIGQGCHRLSELAGRLGKPATSLFRPLQRLVELGMVRRDRPFGVSEREARRTLYRIDDPFLRFWFRYVEPNRSRLEARSLDPVVAQVKSDFTHYLGGIWEDLARASVPRSGLYGVEWNPASAWWGPGPSGKPMELDLVADSVDGRSLLVGSVKWQKRSDLRRVLGELVARTESWPLARLSRVYHAVWSCHDEVPADLGVEVLGPEAVLKTLR